MSRTHYYGGAEPQRVNRWLAQSGVCSRREAEGLIAQGLVSVDGRRIDDPGHKISPGQTLTLADRAESLLQSMLSVVIHKPVGVVSAQPEGRQVPAVRLLTADALWGEASAVPDFANRLAPIGRLDMDSRGLLILSEDGVLAKAVIGPASTLEKEYRVRVRGTVTSDRIARLRHGLQLDGRTLKPARVSLISDQRLRFVLKEGRNRQIRRMCDAVGLEVSDLLRVRVGEVVLGDLPEGRWRPLSGDERTALIGAAPGAGTGVSGVD